MKRHILVISQYFYPEEFRINDICKEWINRGCEVTVLTGIPNYPQGKFYEGYGWFQKRHEEYNGVRVVRLPIIPRGKNALMLIFNYLSFVVSGFVWKTFTRIKADKVFIFEVSPMTQALIGIWYAKRRKVPCLIYVQDLWPENVEIIMGIHNRKIINVIDKMVDYIYRNCSKIFATSPSFVKRLEERKSVWSGGKSKAIYWPQYAEEFYRPVKKSAVHDFTKREGLKIIYTGNIGYAQGLDILPKAAKILKQKDIDCSFYIIGDGRYRKELEHIIKETQVGDMIYLLGRKQPEQIPQYIANCDAAFISFADNSLFAMTIPAKLQSYMACGIPILAAATGETQRVIEEAGCGMTCGLGDYRALEEMIINFINISEQKICDMRENALSYSQQFFNKKNLLDEMEYYLD